MSGHELALEAVIFDMDGVVTDSARLHAHAWKKAFDEFLRSQPFAEGGFRPFELGSDYLLYVDGRPRYDGVKNFLISRDVQLPMGDVQDAPGLDSICALGNLKDQLFMALLSSEGVEVFESSVRLIKELRTAVFRCCIASSSRNCKPVLSVAGLSGAFEAIVDGASLSIRGIKGKPAPDMFLACASDLGAAPHASVVVEDAVAGVKGAHAGGFGLIVGVDRKDDGAQLIANGADVAISDLAGVGIDTLENWMLTKASVQSQP